MYKITFFVPETNLESVKAAVFAAGAGSIGDYELVCFETRGQGQFCPRDGAKPYIGKVGVLETLEEIRVELVCEDARTRAALDALITAHPYEEPAFDVWRLSDLASLPEA